MISHFNLPVKRVVGIKNFAHYEDSNTHLNLAYDVNGRLAPLFPFSINILLYHHQLPASHPRFQIINVLNAEQFL